MIQSFSDDETERLFRTKFPHRYSAVARVALRKRFNSTTPATSGCLAVPPGNRLEALKGRWSGFHSIRINDQWRIVFRWRKEAPAEVAIVDYH